jgi:hypothetical protein
MSINLENSTWDKDQLSEVFALPIGLKSVADLNGEKLYGSEKLNQIFLKAVAKNRRVKPIINKISNLIDDKRINPVFYEKGMLKFIAWKVFAPLNQKYSMAFYVPKYNKIYLVLSNSANIFTHIPNDIISLLMIHELMHMFAKSKQSQFKNIWMDTFIKYYTEIYNMLFNVPKNEIDPKYIEKIVNHQIKYFDTNRNFTPASAFLKYKKMLSELKDKSPLEDKKFDLILDYYIFLGYLYRSDQNRWAKEWTKYYHIVKILEMAYKRAFNFKNVTTMCTQEILIPSEVAAICSENPKFFKKAHQSISKL